jgi:hypothetical protein
LDYPLGTRSGVEDARSIESTSKPPRKAKPIRTFHHWCRQCLCKLGKITLEGVKYSLEGSGATPAGSLARPHGTSTVKTKVSTRAPALKWRLGGYCRGYQQGVPSTIHITRPSVHKTRSSIRRSVHTYAQPSTAAASKTEVASSESIRARAPTAVEYGSGLERIKRRRAQGHCPPPDARTRARAFNAPDASPPNTRVTGDVIREQASVPSFFLQPSHQTTLDVSERGKRGWNV